MSTAIIVRTKNRPDFLQRALRSITEQTATGWECIVINDGGDAAAVDLAIEAASARIVSDSGSSIRAVHHDESRGRWKSANAGVLGTTAPFIVIHDDDDTWHPEFLERAERYLAEHPERDGVVSRIEIRWEEPGANGFVTVGSEIFQPQLADVTYADTLLFNRFVPIGFVYRRSLHEELGLYNDDLPVIGDWHFNLRVLKRGSLEYLGEQPYAFWHQRTSGEGDAGNSVISASGDHRRFDALVRDEALREYVAEHGEGLVLYLTKFIDQRLVDVENGIRREIVETVGREIRESSTWHRATDAVRRRLPRGRRRD